MIAATDLGLKIKSSPIYTSDRAYATFLSRVYPIAGDPASFHDPRRMLGKFGLVAKNSKFTPLELLAAKAHCYLLSDSATPIVGAYMLKFQRLYNSKIREEAIQTVHPFVFDERPDNQYLPVDPTNQHVRYLVGKLLGLSDHIRNVEMKIDAAQKIADLNAIMTVSSNDREDFSGPDSTSLLQILRPLVFRSGVDFNRIRHAPQETRIESRTTTTQATVAAGQGAQQGPATRQTRSAPSRRRRRGQAVHGLNPGSSQQSSA